MFFSLSIYISCVSGCPFVSVCNIGKKNKWSFFSSEYVGHGMRKNVENILGCSGSPPGYGIFFSISSLWEKDWDSCFLTLRKQYMNGFSWKFQDRLDKAQGLDHFVDVSDHLMDKGFFGGIHVYLENEKKKNFHEIFRTGRKWHSELLMASGMEMHPSSLARARRCFHSLYMNITRKLMATLQI